LGQCRSADPLTLHSQKIDRELRRLNFKKREEFKILLLGPGESGKSTIFRQMKIVQDKGGYSEEERLRFKPIVYSNCISQMIILVTVAQKQQLNFDNVENDRAANQLLELQPSEHLWTPEIGLTIKKLWADSAIQTVYHSTIKNYQLNDTADYFFINIDRFIPENYIPSIADVLRVRVRSTGIEEAEFVFDKMLFKVIDVGGQRSERRKWIHCFSQVTSVLFCASLCDYCQKLRENSNINRMDEALELFSEVVNSAYFNTSSIILFLNKVDIFEQKLTEIPLSSYFRTFQGGGKDIACEFIKARFLDYVSDNSKLYPHITCALDTDQIEHVIFDVRAEILKHCIEEIV